MFFMSLNIKGINPVINHTIQKNRGIKKVKKINSTGVGSDSCKTDYSKGDTKQVPKVKKEDTKDKKK